MSLINTIVRGQVYDFTSIEFSVEGTRNFCTLQDINYNWSRDIGILRGNGSPLKRGRTRGEFDFEGSFSMAKEDTRDFHRMLAALGLGSFGEAVFDIIVTYAALGQAQPTIDTLIGCTLKGGDNSHSRGSDPLQVKYDVDIMDIKFDGLSPAAREDGVGAISGAVGGLISTI
jgi:hypothetical protein